MWDPGVQGQTGGAGAGGGAVAGEKMEQMNPRGLITSGPPSSSVVAGDPASLSGDHQVAHSGEHRSSAYPSPTSLHLRN